MDVLDFGKMEMKEIAKCSPESWNQDGTWPNWTPMPKIALNLTLKISLQNLNFVENEMDNLRKHNYPLRSFFHKNAYCSFPWFMFLRPERPELLLKKVNLKAWSNLKKASFNPGMTIWPFCDLHNPILIELGLNRLENPGPDPGWLIFLNANALIVHDIPLYHEILNQRRWMILRRFFSTPKCSIPLFHS